MSTELELFGVRDDFASMLRLRDIMLSEDEDVTALNAEIALYFSHDVTKDKIDQALGATRYCDAMAAIATAEAQRLTALADSWIRQKDWLKSAVKGTLELSGKKRLEGNTAGYFLLKGNGGTQPVEITNASLLPEELVQYEGRISGKAWFAVTCQMSETWLCRSDVQMERVPHKGRIAEALQQKCERCRGLGTVVVSGAPSPCKCSECDGDGLARVPGAHFAPRNSHVEIR